MHNTVRDTGKWVGVPGYLAPISDAYARRTHRAARRSQGNRDKLKGTGQPSHHQMASLILDALGAALGDGGTRNGLTTAFSRGLELVAEVDGVVLDEALLTRIHTRLSVTPDVRERIRQEQVAREVEAARALTEMEADERDRIAQERWDRDHGWGGDED